MTTSRSVFHPHSNVRRKPDLRRRRRGPCSIRTRTSGESLTYFLVRHDLARSGALVFARIDAKMEGLTALLGIIRRPGNRSRIRSGFMRSNNLATSVVFALLLFGSSSPSFAAAGPLGSQEAPSGLDTAKLSQIDTLFQDHVAGKQIAGAVALVARMASSRI